MTLTVSATVERWPVAGYFIISRGAKGHVDVVRCEISDGVHIGTAEATPIYYEGESAEQCAQEIIEFAAQHSELDRATLLQRMPRGAARTAPGLRPPGTWENPTKKIYPLWANCATLSGNPMAPRKSRLSPIISWG